MASRGVWFAAVLALFGAACNRGSSGAMTTAPNTSSWAQANGLEVKLELPGKPVSGVSGGRPSPAVAKLHFRNASQQPLRFYLIESEPFRSFQSRFAVFGQGEGALITMQPEPRPHGYVVTEKDFHLLGPGEEKIFTPSYSPPGESQFPGSPAGRPMWWPHVIITMVLKAAG